VLPHREVWMQHRGPIPRGWVVHVLNGDYDDLRIENLACVPREGSPHKITPPYRERIKELERLLATGD
jgi:hypothetical protein